MHFSQGLEQAHQMATFRMSWPLVVPASGGTINLQPGRG